MTCENRRHKSVRPDLDVLTQTQFSVEYAAQLERKDVLGIVRALTEFSCVLLEIHACIESKAADEQSPDE